jgi:D-arabinose 1-dehydrogenase-like Zn-dependent alcohol dehydrogenase
LEDLISIRAYASKNQALLAGKGKITNASIFTGDSDLMPAIEAVKREGTLCHGGIAPDTRPSAELFALVDERHQLTPEMVNGIRRSH